MLLSEIRNGLIRIAVAYTGKFERDGKPFAITENDLEDMARNLGVREAPLDYEHLSGAASAVPPGWAKAAGWIRKPDAIESFTRAHRFAPLREGSRKILWAWAEFTPAALAMIKSKEYRYFSPEIHWDETDEHGRSIGTRLAAGAITNRPFLKDLPPIELSDADYQSLFGLAARADGKLAAIALSEKGRLIDVDEVHVPTSTDKISVGYQQPASPASTVGARQSKVKGGNVANKKFSLRRMADGPHQGKFALYADEELVKLDDEDVLLDEVDLRKLMDDADAGDLDEDLEEEDLKAGAGPDCIGAGGKKMTEIARLCEIFKDGKVNLKEAARLADERALHPGSIFRAQEAERLVERAIHAGKILPKKRSAAFRMALRDSKAFKALIEDARPIVDFRTYGHSAGHEGVGTAQEELDLEVKRLMTEQKVGYSEALSEITRQNPELWRRASHEIEEQSGRQRVTED